MTSTNIQRDIVSFNSKGVRVPFSPSIKKIIIKKLIDTTFSDGLFGIEVDLDSPTVAFTMSQKTTGQDKAVETSIIKNNIATFTIDVSVPTAELAWKGASAELTWTPTADPMLAIGDVVEFHGLSTEERGLGMPTYCRVQKKVTGAYTFGVSAIGQSTITSTEITATIHRSLGNGSYYYDEGQMVYYCEAIGNGIKEIGLSSSPFFGNDEVAMNSSLGHITFPASNSMLFKAKNAKTFEIVKVSANAIQIRDTKNELNAFTIANAKTLATKYGLDVGYLNAQVGYSGIDITLGYTSFFNPMINLNLSAFASTVNGEQFSVDLITYDEG